MAGRFEGDLHVRWLDDGRLMELTSPFCFFDDAELAWSVPSGTRTDGASIPRFLWSIIGGPFEGKYRKAAVVHDYYCDVRQHSWRDVHSMFYAAMVTANVPHEQAKILYYGVLIGGPRWTDQASHNTRIATGCPFPMDKQAIRLIESGGLDYVSPEISEECFSELSVDVDNMTLNDIEERAESKRKELVYAEYESLLSRLR